MRLKFTYSIEEVRPYINWIYFDYAWGMSSGPKEELLKLHSDAAEALSAFSGKYSCHALFALFSANSDGDDIVSEGFRLPLLRQQRAHNGICLCLSDYLCPLSSGVRDRIGVFATSVDSSLVEDNNHDDYQRMMAQTLADRLAEASAELLHTQVRRTYWGYASDERLSVSDILKGRYQGIRPAIGYPSLPDVSLNFMLNDILHMEDIGIRLTQSGMMTPHASVSGLMLAHPEARYFELGKIGEDQLSDYARRRGLPRELLRKFLQSSLMKP